MLSAYNVPEMVASPNSANSFELSVRTKLRQSREVALPWESNCAAADGVAVGSLVFQGDQVLIQTNGDGGGGGR